MRGHDIVARALVDEGIDTVFGLIGDANLFIADCLVREHGVRYVAATHEAAVTLMALGYARASGQVGVGTITHGPALTNTMTALVEGVRSRTPLLLVAGDTDPADPHHLQNIDQRALVAAVGAGFEPVRSVDTIAVDVAAALRRAHARAVRSCWTSRRRRVRSTPITCPPRGSTPCRCRSPDHEALDRAVGIIASALTGPSSSAGGARYRPAPATRSSDWPTGSARRWPRRCRRRGGSGATPSTSGIFGTLATPLAAESIAGADCVVAFGAGLNYFTTDPAPCWSASGWCSATSTRPQVGALHPVDAGLVGDAGEVADTIVRWLDQAEHKPSGFRSPELERRLREEGRFAATAQSGAPRLRARSTPGCSPPGWTACSRPIARWSSTPGGTCTTPCGSRSPSPWRWSPRMGSGRSASAWPPPSVPASPAPTGPASCWSGTAGS